MMGPALISYLFYRHALDPVAESQGAVPMGKLYAQGYQIRLLNLGSSPI